MSKINAVLLALVSGLTLPPSNKDHALKGDYIGHRECHISPDWLLIYRIDEPYIVFVRTGTHSDLF